MRHNILETIMGAIVIMVAVVFLTFAYSKGNTAKEGSYIVKAQFDRIDGIKVGSDVRLSGVQIGNVTNLTIDSKLFLADVTMGLNPQYPLPDDSSAEIVSDGLLGSKYVSIVPGGSTKDIPNGGTVKHTQASISIESLIGKLMFGKEDETKSSDK
jgi:phospholipid/cholesterol/gamma-HCH transport system substrate-binding protein